jgi:hypothetical protein
LALALVSLALAGLLVPARARAAVDPSSACDQGVSAAYIQWAASTTGAALTTATAPVFDSSFASLAAPAAYFAQGKQLLKFRTSDGVRQWSWCPPNITNCTSAQGATTINSAPTVVRLSTASLHGCGPTAPETPCDYVFFGGPDGFVYRLSALNGTSVISADTRRKLNGAPACQTAPGDSIDSTPAVVLYSFADTTPGSRGRAFRDDIDATAGHAGDDVVIVITNDGCGDRTRNRIIALWAKDLTTKWIFNADGEVKMDRSMAGCTIDYAAMRVYCGTDLVDEAAGQSSLFALDVITGALLWSENAGAILNRPTLNSSANVLYVVSKAGAVMAYDPAGRLGRAAPRWPNPVAVAPAGRFINKPLSVESGTGTWQNRILVMDSSGGLHAVADCDLPNAPAGCAADGKHLWSRAAFGSGISFKSRPIVLPGAATSRAFIGRSDGYMQMLELSDTDLAYRGIVTANPGAPGNNEVFDPAFDPVSPLKIAVVSGTQISYLQRDPALMGQGDPNELFCNVAPYGNAGCSNGGIGGNSCNRAQFDQYNPCLIYTCNPSPSVCLKVTSVKPTGMVPDGTPCNDEWSGAPRGPMGVCTSSTLMNATTTDANCASATCPGCVAAPNPPYFQGKACTTNTDCWPCRTAANTPVNTTNLMCRCPSGPLIDPIPCNVPLSGVCVCNSASMAANLTNAQALDLCNDACIAGTCTRNTYTSCNCINAGDLQGCSPGFTCCGSLTGGCVDLLNDPEHCGSCSNDCNTYHATSVPCTLDSACTDFENGSCYFSVTSSSCAVDSDCTALHGPNAKCSGSPGGLCYTGSCRYLTQAGTCVDGACADWPACPSPDVGDLESAAVKGVDALAFSRAITCDAFVTTYRTTAPVPDAPCGPACASDAACGGGDCTNGFCCPAGKSCVGGTCRVANVQSISPTGTVGYFTTGADVSRMHGVGVLRSGTTAFGSFVNDPAGAGTAGLGVASGATYSHPLTSGATVGAPNEPFAATEFDRGPVGPAVDTAVSTDADWTVYFGNFVAGACTDKHLCRITGSATAPVAWINQACIEPLPGDGICVPAADLSPERITALAFGQRKYSPPDVFHRYLIVAHGTTLSFLDLDGGFPVQKDIDLTNRNIYDPTTPNAMARGESTPVAVLSTVVVPYDDIVIEVRGSNGNRWLLNVDAHDQSARHQRAVQRDIQDVHPCAAGGVCPDSSTCVQGVCLSGCNTGTCPDGKTCTLIGGGTCESPGGGSNPVCCIDDAVPNNFGTTDGRLSVTPTGQLLRFVPSATGALAANWKEYQLSRGGACTGTTEVVNDSVRVSQAGTAAGVSWTDSPGLFNVYRGSRSGAWSYNHTCFASLVPGPVTDTDVPPIGTAAYYLVSRVTGCGESSLGAGRPNPSPCP